MQVSDFRFLDVRLLDFRIHMSGFKFQVLASGFLDFGFLVFPVSYFIFLDFWFYISDFTFQFSILRFQISELGLSWDI